jgi:hypothetical protein
VNQNIVYLHIKPKPFTLSCVRRRRAGRVCHLFVTLRAGLSATIGHGAGDDAAILASENPPFADSSLTDR